MKSGTSTEGAALTRQQEQEDFESVLQSEYCECNEQPYEEEEASNVCSACGKPLE